MRRVLSLFAVASLAIVFGTGCPSYSTLHTARPVQEGTTEITLSPGYTGASVSSGDVAISGDVPNIEVAGRHGLNKDMDVGAKVYPIGAAFDFNYAFVNTPDLAVSINPYLSVVRLSSSATDGNGNETEASATFGYLLANVLADVVTTDMLAVTVGLKPGLQYAFGSVGESSDAGVQGVVGAMAGLTVKLTEGFAIMPSFDMIAPVTDGFGDIFYYTGSLAFKF